MYHLKCQDELLPISIVKKQPLLISFAKTDLIGLVEHKKTANLKAKEIIKTTFFPRSNGVYQTVGSHVCSRR